MTWRVAKNLDLTGPTGPRLGSWMTAGGLPGFTPRDIDRNLKDRLEEAAAAGGLVVVSGAPKAGKTRTLLEALGRVVPDRVVWSLLPAVGVAVDDGRLIDPVAQVVWRVSTGQFQAGQVVVVLDDLHTFLQVGPNQLTEKRLRSMTDLGLLVVATVHVEAVTRIRNYQQGTAGSDLRLAGSQALLAGEDRALLTTIEAATVPLPSELTDAELAGLAGDIASAAAARDMPVERMRRLPEVLAAVDKMKTVIGESEHDSDHPERWALLKAAFASSVCNPLGATEDQLRELYGWAKTRPGDGFDQALKWATAPIGGPDSLNALITNADLPETWRLFDAIASHLTETRPGLIDWLTPHLTQLEPIAALYVGSYQGEHGNPGVARRAYQLLIDSGQPNAVPTAAVHLAALEREAEDFPAARAAYQVAIDSGHRAWAPMAAALLGTLEQNAGDLPAARVAFQLGIDSGDDDAAPMAAVRLGTLEQEAGDLPAARVAFQVAIDSDDTFWAAAAAFDLGTLEREAGDFPAARVAFQMAIDSHESFWAAAAAFDLGTLEREAGDFSAARVAFQVAIDSGNTDQAPIAADYLGTLEREAGDLPAARAAFQVAIDSDNTFWAAAAGVDLGKLEWEAEDLPAARVAFQMSIDSGHPDWAPAAAEYLGKLEQGPDVAVGDL